MRIYQLILGLFLPMLCLAQINPYDTKWEKIDQSLSNGEFASILPEVLELKKSAKNNNHMADYIKALFYESKIKIVTTDETDDVNFVFQNFKAELDGKSKVKDAVISSYLANLYQIYYNENRWKINSRTNLENTSSDDIRFWTENHFNKIISEYYQRSIQPKDLLLKENLNNWNVILDGVSKESSAITHSSITPTLYDILVHNYINYLHYSDDNKGLIDDFLKDLITINRKNKQFEAVLYNEYKRLDGLENSISNSERIQKKEALLKLYPSAKFNAYILADLAKDYYDLNENKKQNIARVFEIKSQINQAYPNSAEALEVNKLIDQIQLKEFSTEAEKHVVPNQNIPFKVIHKNIDQLFVRVLEYNKSDNTELSKIYVSTERSLKQAQEFLNNLNKVDEYTINLKAFDDYQNHSTVAKLNPLKQGRYIVVFSTDASFQIADAKQMSYLDIYATKYATHVIKDVVSVVDRQSGEPLSNVKVNFKNRNYNQTNETKIVTTDKNGFAKIPTEFNNYSYQIAGDLAEYSNYRYRYNEEVDDIDFQAKIFTDRGIYRPGQTVYFKAIVYRLNGKDMKVVANKKLHVYLEDYNGKEIESLDLQSNEFGSIQGNFVLPANGATGNFQMYVEEADGDQKELAFHDFQVEEYKRPKFEVEIEENKGVYSLNDEIKVDGKAIAFSGATIDQAEVEYRVYRQESYLFWPWWKRIPTHGGDREEITFGQTKTDAEGKFTFNFIAKPAKDKQKDENRLYTYYITAEVTDINGETHTVESSVMVGDTRLKLEVDVPQKTTVEHVKEFKVTVQNLNNVKQDGKGELEIYQVLSPKEVLRTQKFETDYQIYSREEFKKLFPNEPYGDELDQTSWKVGNRVFSTTFDTKVSDKINFENAKSLEEGYYVIKAFVWDGSEKVSIDRLVYISNPNKTSKTYELVTATLDKSVYMPKEKAIVTFNTGLKEAYVVYSVGYNNKVIKEGVLNLSKSKTLEIPIEENYRGGLYVKYVLTKYNDFRTNVLSLNIPNTNNELKITTSVLRDKLTPGSEEKWQLKVEGPNKDKFTAEVLAGMYDASLDQFVGNDFSFNPTRSNNSNPYYSYGYQNGFDKIYGRIIYYRNRWYFNLQPYSGYALNLFDFTFSQRQVNYMMRKTASPAIALEGKVAGIAMEESANLDLQEVVTVGVGGAANKMTIRGNSSVEMPNAIYVIDGVVYDAIPNNLTEKDFDSINVLKSDQATAIYGARGANGVIIISTKANAEKLNQVQARKNLEELAFFYPNLKTDANGNVLIEFTTPESLTQWKFMALAHTPDLKTGYYEQKVRTQKELMVVPNMPRFLREGDQISISTKINNLSDQALNGTAKLMLFDAFSMQPVDGQFNLNTTPKNFTVAKGASDQVSWTIQVPKNIQAVVYRVVAVAGDFSDGEESALPILTNRMMVTETMPIYIKENQKKTFNFENLTKNQSKTLDHFKLTFEMTANPIWNAVFALPYLREYPYECAEQVFSRLYGNMVSEKILNDNPKIKAVFDDWNKKGELKSKLMVNEELKNIILEETPWVRNAESEETQIKQIATLFQLNQMRNEMKAAFDKLSDKQLDNGAFGWFDGGYANEYITTHIVAGFGNMKKMNVNYQAMGIDVNPLVSQAINYLDQENLKRYIEFKKDLKSFTNITYSDGIHYLYARSFFLDQYPMGKELEEMKNVMLKNLNDKKLDLSLQQKAMAALVLNRFGMESAAKQVINSTKERAVHSDEMGMYWKENQPGWFWYSAPVETQAFLIEAYDEVLKDINSVEEMKVWLLKNKQTNQWNSTKATTKAVYALMNTGKSWIDAEKGIKVKIGNTPFDLQSNAQVGSGYVKTSWTKDEIKPEMGKVEVEKTTPGVAWGAMYWQYFEDLDQIKSAETGIKFNKKLFIKQNSANGPILKEITPQTPIKVGDVVTVRLEISIDRNMQFVHIKDMRASGFEPVNVLSGYKWKGEFGYYESTRDAATNFFADYMRKGTYVFEYDLKANNAGNFSNGITSMQNMYAPELSAHSEGIRVNIQ